MQVVIWGADESTTVYAVPLLSVPIDPAAMAEVTQAVEVAQEAAEQAQESAEAAAAIVVNKADILNSGKVFSSRSAAETSGQAPADYGVTLNREGSFLELRAPNQATDALFPTAPRWGVLARYPSSVYVDNGLAGKANAADLVVVSDEVKTKVGNDNPANTDAGLNVKDRDGKVLLRADEDGTFLAGRAEPLEKTLDLLTLPVVRPTSHAGGLDIKRMTDLTADSRAALAQGLAARGGRIAPVPTCVMPQPTDWGTSWLSTQRIPIGPASPRINADPIYRENVDNPQFVHPHVMHFPHGFLGYEYLMCINPYPGGNDQLENPILYGSHDMIDWQLFRHLDQPLADASRYGDGANFLSDNTLFYDPLTGELICMWRRHKWVGQLTTYEWRSTLDGIHWSDIRVCYENVNTEAGSAAPDMVYNPTDGLWYLYFSSDSKFMCRTKRDFRDMSEPWSAPVETGVNGWHQEIRVLGDRLWMFSCIGTNNIAFNAHRSRPGDWTKFDLVRNQVLDASAFIAEYGSATTYKNSLVPHLYSDGTAQVKALVQCRRAQSEWWMFYGESPRTPIGA